MKIFVSGATSTHRRYWDDPNFGFLVTPRSGRVHEITETGKAWGVDNEAFGGWDERKELSFSKLLGRLCEHRPHPSLKFVACPDVVADAVATRESFDRWGPIVRTCGLPVGYVLQDGESDVPWGKIDALFVGGSTEWKLSEHTDAAIAEAKRLGKWVHVGRVNTLRRMRHFYDIGVDSIDGTTFSKWPDKYFPAALRWLRALEREPSMFATRGLA